ncbi:MAG: hypothetical protein EOO73_14970 [Myxococcales bacterium]|nr:MAG: hypothetical protein EOO73_14970 [Myxococcales bacterium]
MQTGVLIDAIVRQTTILLAQLATSGGGRTQLAHTANQVFLDLVAALKEQGLGNKVIADMFGMALRTYQTKLQRLSESRTDRGRSLWEALFTFVQERGRDAPVARTDILQRFRHDDPLSVGGVLRDLVDSGLLYRSGRGDFACYGVAQPSSSPHGNPDERVQGFVWLCVHRLAPATAEQVTEALSLERALVDRALSALLADGRIRPSERLVAAFESDSCVLPLGSEQGWEVALFDHYQAMVAAVCSKLALGKRAATARDLIGGSTFSFDVWKQHPHYDEVVGFLGRFRAEGTALRKKVSAYNDSAAAPAGAEQRVVIYAGQNVLGIDDEREEEA